MSSSFTIEGELTALEQKTTNNGHDLCNLEITEKKHSRAVRMTIWSGDIPYAVGDIVVAQGTIKSIWTENSNVRNNVIAFNLFKGGHLEGQNQFSLVAKYDNSTRYENNGKPYWKGNLQATDYKGVTTDYNIITTIPAVGEVLMGLQQEQEVEVWGGLFFGKEGNAFSAYKINPREAKEEEKAPVEEIPKPDEDIPF